MATSVISTRIDAEEKGRFERLAKALGLSVQDFIRILIAKANREQGVALFLQPEEERQVARNGTVYYPFTSEAETLDWSDNATRDLWEHENETV